MATVKRILMRDRGLEYTIPDKKGKRLYYQGGIFPTADNDLAKLLLASGGVELDEDGEPVKEDAPQAVNEEPASGPAPAPKKKKKRAPYTTR